jgi:hypothetical protein
MPTTAYEAKPGRLVVCERSGRWAMALRRELAGAGLRVWETRNMADCGALLGESPASFVVLELFNICLGDESSPQCLSSNSQPPAGRPGMNSSVKVNSVSKIEETLDFVRNWQAEFPLVRFAIVADRELAAYKWLMHEAGAVDFICSVRKIGALAQMACRHLAQVPPLPQSLTERIWASLPWGK